MGRTSLESKAARKGEALFAGEPMKWLDIVTRTSFGQWAQAQRPRERTRNGSLSMWVFGRGGCVELWVLLRPAEPGKNSGPGE